MITRALAALSRAEFSNLGWLYLGPARFVKVGPVAYLALMVGGAVWIAAAAAAGWALVRRGRAWLGTFLFLLGTGAYVTLAFPPTTDEPHYLALTDNLLTRGTLEVSAGYASGAWRAFFPGATLDAHAVVLPDGRMYSQHTAGLPLLILPGYALAGRWGVLLILAAIAACLPGLLERVARHAGAAARESRALAVCTALSAPFLFASTLVFTEVPAAVLAAAGLLAAGSGGWAAACMAGLPWLHPRYAWLAVGVFTLDLARSRRRVVSVAWWAGLAAVSGGLFLAVYHGPAFVAIFNVLSERYPAPLATVTAGGLAGQVAFANLPVSLLGKLVDRSFGLLPYAPWFLVLGPGWGTATRHGRGALLLGATYLFVTCLFANWGGSAYPGRTLVPLLPFAAPVLAAGIRWAGGTAPRRAVFAALFLVSVLQACALTACPVLRYTSGRDWLAARAGAAYHVLPFSWWPAMGGGTGAVTRPPAAVPVTP